MCVDGQWVSEHGCAQCQVDFYCAQTQLRACPPFSTTYGNTNATTVSDCLCKFGYYKQGTATQFQCVACPEGAFCDHGQVYAAARYWKYQTDPTKLKKCYSEASIAGSPPKSCAGVDDCLTANKDRVNQTCLALVAVNNPNHCVKGASGPLCLHCKSTMDEGYAMSSQNTCQACKGL